MNVTFGVTSDRYELTSEVAMLPMWCALFSLETRLRGLQRGNARCGLGFGAPALGVWLLCVSVYGCLEVDTRLRRPAEMGPPRSLGCVGPLETRRAELDTDVASTKPSHRVVKVGGFDSHTRRVSKPCEDVGAQNRCQLAQLRSKIRFVVRVIHR